MSNSLPWPSTVASDHLSLRWGPACRWASLVFSSTFKCKQTMSPRTLDFYCCYNKVSQIQWLILHNFTIFLCCNSDIWLTRLKIKLSAGLHCFLEATRGINILAISSSPDPFVIHGFWLLFLLSSPFFPLSSSDKDSTFKGSLIRVTEIIQPHTLDHISKILTPRKVSGLEYKHLWGVIFPPTMPCKKKELFQISWPVSSLSSEPLLEAQRNKLAITHHSVSGVSRNRKLDPQPTINQYNNWLKLHPFFTNIHLC